MKNAKDLKKFMTGLVIALVVFIVGMNSFTIVGVNKEASVQSFGKVHLGKIYEGFNLVLPWWAIDEYDLNYETEVLEDLGVASQDKFKTQMDVAYTGHFVEGQADKTRDSTGSSSQFLTTHVEQRVLSCLTKAGAEVVDSQAFFDKRTQERMSESVNNCVNDYLVGVGGSYVMTSIQFSDIRLAKAVQRFIIETKKRQEAENQQESALNIADLKAQEKVKIAEANKLAAVQDAEGRKTLAEAKRYEMEQEAAGNVALSKSITPNLVKYIEAQAWNGSKATTILGSDTKALLNTK
jgi:regulator of protease activity HflC (stomatin/prohibitin superfamily)